jgi:hypothetical protein
MLGCRGLDTCFGVELYDCDFDDLCRHLVGIGLNLHAVNNVQKIIA